MANIFYNISPIHIKTLYYSLNYKTKEKIDMILEPLQSMIQLALLSICQIGSKLTIQQNILYIQQPTMLQPITRWYNSDKKDDIFFLFQVIRRFIKWYNPHINKKSPINNTFYQLIIKMSVIGLDNLLKTYDSNEVITIAQIINMYKNLLQSTDNKEIDTILNEKEGINMDEVFQNIIFLYDIPTLNLINNALIMINNEKDEIYISSFIDGINLIMNQKYKNIQKWIKDNLII